MRKIILLILLVFPLYMFGNDLPKIEKPDINQFSGSMMRSKSSGVYLQSASKNFLIGTGLFVVGASAVTLSATLLNDYNAQQPVLILGGLTSLAGLVFSVKGYIDIGKAGKRLNYEIGAGRAGLVFNW